MRSTTRWTTSLLCALCIACPFAAFRAASAQEIQRPIPDDTVIAAAREIIEAARFGALITLDERGSPRVRAMDPFAPDEHMVVWLGTHRATRKVADIQRDPRVALYYLAPDGDGYASISGIARLVDDSAEKAHRWKDEWERYYADREADYLLIMVRPVRLEVVNYRLGVVGDAATWRPPAVEFHRR